jgi:hypothetical protein
MVFVMGMGKEDTRVVKCIHASLASLNSERPQVPVETVIILNLWEGLCDVLVAGGGAQS